jgi:hypothetical protein
MKRNRPRERFIHENQQASPIDGNLYMLNTNHFGEEFNYCLRELRGKVEIFGVNQLRRKNLMFTIVKHQNFQKTTDNQKLPKQVSTT